MNLKSILAGVVGFAMAALIAGCSSSYPKTEVKVTLDGKPVADATVTLIPDSADTTTGASGQTDANGICSLSTPTKPGVPKGTYKVIVTKSEVISDIDEKDPIKSMQKQFNKQGGNKAPGGGGMPGMPGGRGPTGPSTTLPVKYAQRDTTDLKLTVPTNGVTELKLVSDGSAPTK